MRLFIKCSAATASEIIHNQYEKKDKDVTKESRVLKLIRWPRELNTLQLHKRHVMLSELRTGGGA